MNTKEFFDYLIYIGVLKNENIQLLKSIIDKKTRENEGNNIDKNIFMKSLMSEYLTSLTKDDLNKLGENIYDRYIKNKMSTISKHLGKIFDIYHKFLYIKFKAFFHVWKNKSLKGNSSRTKMIKRSKSTDKLYRASASKQNNYTFNLNNFYINSINQDKYNNNNNNKNIKDTNSDFFNRLNIFNDKKENDKKMMRTIKEDDLSTNCTFTPNLYLTKNRNNKFRKRYTSYKQNKFDDDDNLEGKPKRKVDNDRMLKLYYDFQRKNLNNEKLKENIDRENGITFTPKLNSNSEYNKKIKENFFERNQKFLENKKDFVNGFNLLRDLQMKGIDINLLSQEK